MGNFFGIGDRGAGKAPRAFRADELGSTKVVRPSDILGQKGAFAKMLDLKVPDSDASPLVLSFRAEYAIEAETVSADPSAPQPISNATNAAPIVITTPAAHGLTTGQFVTITGVTGNTAANGVFTITVVSATTFSLNGSVGNGLYLANGEYVFFIGPVTVPGEGSPFIGGPLVGRVEWGVGGAKNVIEFDIPSCRLPNDVLLPPFANNPVGDIGNGVQLYVNASGLDVYARNDANLNPLNAVGQTRIGILFPAKILCFVAPGASRGGAPLQRTIWIVSSLAGGFVMTPGAVVNCPIPLFAKRVRFNRIPIQTNPLRVTFLDMALSTMREVIIPVNGEGPIEVQAHAQIMRVQNLGAVDILDMQAVFDVDPI